MNDKIKKHEPREVPEHFTSTVELVEKFEACTNPVTKAGYRSMIAARIGLTERQEQIRKSRNYSMLMYLEKCTYSFASRTRMRAMFELWFMK